MSEEDGKPTGWRADYKNGKWVEEHKPKKKAKAKSQSRKKAASR